MSSRFTSAADQKFEADVKLTMRYHIPRGLTPEKFRVIYGTAYATRVFKEARRRISTLPDERTAE